MSKNLFTLIYSDLIAAKKRDPAARNHFEIFFTYSGFHAIFFHRFSNLLWKIKLKFVARFLSSITRILTSIEIHPSAQIGHSFFIDHGAGLVIGETSIIGNNVTMYQQTTLGGLSHSIDSISQRNGKRHPTLQENVIIGSGAQVLGPVVIGSNSRIGANAVVLNDVPPNMTFVGIPARKIQSEIKKNSESFDAYGICEGKIDDPNKKSINALFKEIHILNEKILELQNKLSQQQKVGDNFRIKQRDKKKIKDKQDIL